MEEDLTNSEISIIDMTLLGITSMLMVTGLMNKDWFINYALLGPIFMFCIGLCIQVIIIEYKNGFSEALDIKVSHKLQIDLSKSQIHSRKIVNNLLLGFFFLSLMFAIWVLGRLSENLPILDTFSWFALFMMVSSICLGLRLFRAYIDLRNLMSNEEESVNLNSRSLKEEHRLFSLWLLSSDFNLTKLDYEKSLRIQRDSFMKQINANTDLVGLVKSLHLNSIEYFEEKLLEYLDPKKTKWYRGIKDYLSEPEIDQSAIRIFHGLLLLPIVVTLLKKTIHDKGAKNIEISNLFDYLSEYVERQNYAEMMISPNVSNDSLHPLKSTDEDIGFLRELSYFSTKSGTFDWEPWWLLSIRIRMVVLRNTPRWKLIKPFVTSNNSDRLFEALSLSLTKINHSSSNLKSKDFEGLVKQEISSLEGIDKEGEAIEFNLFHQLSTTTHDFDPSRFKLLASAWNLFDFRFSNEESLFGDNSDKILEHKTVSELKQMLRGINEKVTGRKAELIDRLKGLEEE